MESSRILRKENCELLDPLTTTNQVSSSSQVITHYLYTFGIVHLASGLWKNCVERMSLSVFLSLSSLVSRLSIHYAVQETVD